MRKFTLTWKGWRFYVEGDLCVATDTRTRLTHRLPPLANDQHSFFRATEELKDAIRKLGR